MNKFLVIGVCLLAAANVAGQSRSKPVQQPREVREAYRVCAEFQRSVAENFEFEPAFEATFTKDPARRRKVAIAESLYGIDVSQLDESTVVEMYKLQSQALILAIPFLFVADDTTRAELIPPHMEAMFDRPPAKDLESLLAYMVQLKQDVVVLRAHFDKLLATNAFFADRILAYRNHLKRPLDPPHKIVRPLTAYSKGQVLPVHAKYYQIEDCAVIREANQMRIIGYTFLRARG
jgi:hypothetical protein